MKRGLALILAALLAALTLTACGGGAMSGSDSGSAGPSASSGGASGENWNSAAQEWGFEPDEPQEAPADDFGDGGGEDRLANAKMVYTASMEVETTEFDSCSAGLESLVDRMGGYLEYASTGSYGDGRRNGSYTVRVPSARFNDFLKSVGEIGHVVAKDRNAQNISEMYYDTESRLTTQKTKMERLQMLLAKAENMEDIIALESAIAETELQIEQLTGSLRHYDALVDFATVEIRLREVVRLSTVEEAPPTFQSRLGNAFVDGLQAFVDFLQGLAIFLAFNWLWMLVLALIVLLAVRISRRKQARGTASFGGAGGRESGFFRRKSQEPKNPDDKQR